MKTLGSLAQSGLAWLVSYIITSIRKKKKKEVRLKKIIYYRFTIVVKKVLADALT